MGKYVLLLMTVISTVGYAAEPRKWELEEQEEYYLTNNNGNNNNNTYNNNIPPSHFTQNRTWNLSTTPIHTISSRSIRYQDLTYNGSSFNNAQIGLYNTISIPDQQLSKLKISVPMYVNDNSKTHDYKNNSSWAIDPEIKEYIDNENALWDSFCDGYDTTVIQYGDIASEVKRRARKSEWQRTRDELIWLEKSMNQLTQMRTDLLQQLDDYCKDQNFVYTSDKVASLSNEYKAAINRTYEIVRGVVEPNREITNGKPQVYINDKSHSLSPLSLAGGEETDSEQNRCLLEESARWDSFCNSYYPGIEELRSLALGMQAYANQTTGVLDLSQWREYKEKFQKQYAHLLSMLDNKTVQYSYIKADVCATINSYKQEINETYQLVKDLL